MRVEISFLANNNFYMRIVLAAAYLYALTKWKLPKSDFSDNIAHESHISNVALKEVFVSAIVALPILLALAWLSERVT